MRAWRIRLESADGRAPQLGRRRWSAAFWAPRIGWLAALGAWYLSRPDWPVRVAAHGTAARRWSLNFAWIAFDREGRSLLDLAGAMRASCESR